MDRMLRYLQGKRIANVGLWYDEDERLTLVANNGDIRFVALAPENQGNGTVVDP